MKSDQRPAASGGKLFGTDGVRGKVGLEPMVPDTIVRLGHAIGTVLGGRGQEVIVGKDTRLSGYMVESAIEAGLAGTGIDIALTGPLPTSAVARLVSEEGACAGIVISASHNPFQDNGIKVFGPSGAKLSDGMEAEIERLTAMSGGQPSWVSEPGKARRIDDAVERYVDFCLACVPGLDLTGRKILVDASNGAAYAAAPAALRRAGAEVHELGCEPDGRNINLACGSQEPQVAAGLVVDGQLEVGIVLDGDADRLIMVNADGALVDGDAYLHILCSVLHGLGRAPAGVVGTLMSNGALADALQAIGVDFVRAAVGDRNVARELIARDWLYGGEPSGHLLLRDLHVTGDGLLAALVMLKLLADSGTDLVTATRAYQPFPSVMSNFASDDPLALARRLEDEVARLQAQDGVRRIVLRPSGTEPVLRLLVEAGEAKLANEVTEAVSRVVFSHSNQAQC